MNVLIIKEEKELANSLGKYLSAEKNHCGVASHFGNFDNRNSFFSGLGFEAQVREKENALPRPKDSREYKLPTKQGGFENALGRWKEDLHKEAIKFSGKSSFAHIPFFQVLKIISNHIPYSFSDGNIDFQLSSRNAAGKYTDHAFGKFIAGAQTNPWFKNAVFIILADPCASSAGKREINSDKHLYPVILYYLPHEPQKKALTNSYHTRSTLEN